ncbi:MAG: HD domain-containing protein [Clostridia bacterium]|nr:HD domain-containing protein [Clostridia bacterium]
MRRDDDARALSAYATKDADAVRRRDVLSDRPNVWRTPFIRDVDKILHCPFYNRYADKTQVFSFYRNDDLTRRSLHVQLVSRIARTIGRALGLNLDLIEAIALGHDIGHTPFGHAGEEYLDRCLCEKTGRHFAHNLHSVRVLDGVFPYNITIQTLSGIACHDGELELSEYRPRPTTDFDEFDATIAACEADKSNIRRLIPSTLEGCVVRISDIIAYLGKDRQDAARARLSDGTFPEGSIGSHNAEIINNLIVNIIDNSYGKGYIKMDEEHFAALSEAKRVNYDLIYKNDRVRSEMENSVRPMMEELYDRLLSDLVGRRYGSPIYTHHIRYVNEAHYHRDAPYENGDPNRIVTDYIASMTDDYFVDLYAHLFPDSKKRINYHGYFD